MSVIAKTELKLGKAAFIHQHLIEDCKRGSDRARFQLYELYAKAMFNVCYRMMNNREDAEDMLQEVFLQAFSKLDSFRYESSFGTWIKTIAIRSCINAIKKRKIDLVFCEEIFDHAPSEEETDAVKLTAEEILKAMEELPEGGRIVFSLYLLEGYDHGEISTILGITESTSKSQYMRAKRRVQEILRNQQMQTA
ncbi:RNA polymerase sigma factor [Sunxiuqinia sp. A32]|uniref:RNA polymerase sigma factor n=1 Tax=Sunxiuqinia sp. A32 TaxID=3461496 RepID=UPI00404613CD